MNLSKQEAGEALDVVLDAGRRVREFRGAQYASQYLILWGLAWFVANCVVFFAPEYAYNTWLAVIVTGAVFTAWITVRQVRARSASGLHTRAERAEIGRRAAMIGCSVLAFFPAMLAVLAPLSGQETNAFISLFWAFAYMASGAWFGTRMFIAGLTTAVATLVGYFLLKEHYFLWMAVVGGGSLLLAGFWLRRP